MPARIAEIGDALVTRINAGTYSQSITATRLPIVLFKLEELKAGTKVSVVPRATGDVNENRAANMHDYTFDIGIQAKLDAITNAAVDPWLLLVEEVADQIRDCKIANTRNVSVEIDPIYASEHLTTYQQFTSVITARFISRE